MENFTFAWDNKSETSSTTASIFGDHTSFSRVIPQIRPTKVTPSPEIFGHPSLILPFQDWNTARKLFGWAWELHLYAVGSLFALVAFYSFICIIQLFRIPISKREQGYFCLLHLIIFLFGVSRAVFLVLDPYNYYHILPRPVAAVLLHLSFPCLITSFSMILAALVKATNPKSYSRIIHGYALFGLIFVNFSFAISVEVLVDFLLSSTEIGAFIVASHTYFIAWSVGLSFGYWLIFSSLLSAARDADGIESGPTGARRVSVGLHITLFASFLLLIFGGLHVFGLISVYGYFNRRSVSPWIWYSFHSAARITELILAALLAFVASLIVWSSSSSYGLNVLSRSISPDDVERRQQLLLDRAIPPGSPSLIPKNRRDFPVTFNPDGPKCDEDFFAPRFAVGRQRYSTGARKPDCHLLESNPIHVSDEERFG